MQLNDTPTDPTKNSAEKNDSQKSTTNSETQSDKHFDKMQEHEIGDPLHESPKANFISENAKSLDKRLSENLEKITQPLEPKNSESTDIKREHEIGDPKKENPKSENDKTKPTTEADNMDRVDTVREHEIGDPETITKEKISADDSLEAEKKQEHTKLDIPTTIGFKK